MENLMAKMVKKITLLLILCVLMVIGGCGGSGSGDEQTATISGNIIAGPVKNAIVTAYKLNSDGDRGDVIGVSLATDVDGFYSIDNPDWTGPVFIQTTDITNATYTDEATEVENTPLNVELTTIAYIDSLTKTIAITPITHIASQLITDNTQIEIDAKNQLVAEQFGLMQISDNTKPIDITSVKPDDITNSAVINKSLDDEKLYALALAGISQSQENDTTGNIDTLDKIIERIVDDLEKPDKKLSKINQENFSAGVSGYITYKQILDNNTEIIRNPIIYTIIKNNVTDFQYLPTADAGTDKEVVEKGRTVSFDGSASRTYNGTTNLSYEWILLIKPKDSDAQLSSYNTSSTVLTSGTSDPVGTRYVATLKVIDTVKTDDEYFHVNSVAIEVTEAPPFDCTMDVITPTTVDENATYTSNAPTFSGTDKDNKTGNWTYTINPSASPFSVVSSTGVITMAPIDYEAGTTTYTVILTATDQAIPANIINKTLTITITNIVDLAPSLTDPQPSSPYTVSEDAAVGDVLGSLIISANDSDASGTTIALTGTGSENFEVVNDSGTWKIKVKASLDFEATESYSLTATATNDVGNGTPVAVTINVTNVVDLAPTLTAPLVPYTVPENAALGEVVGNIVIESDDLASTNTTIALTGTGNENFEVVNDSSTWKIKVKASLDFEATESYSLTTTATNDVGNGTPVAVTINVTNVLDLAPTLTEPSVPYTVPENAAVGDVVGEIVIESDDIASTNTTIALTGTGNGDFEVVNDSSTWKIKVKASLDFEATESYSLTATATNDAGSGTPVAVIINVTNVAKITDMTLDTPADLTYFPGASIQFIVSYDADVTVDDTVGKPAINLYIGSTDLEFIYTGKAEYSSDLTTAHNVSTDIVFEYIVGNADTHTDIDGIQITDLSIDLNSGTIEDASDNDASLDFTNDILPDLTKVLVDAKMWNIMTGAGFIYIPTWDVNSDGTKEPGFWMAKYEAKKDSGSAAIPANT